jgi:ribonuclease Z
LSGNNNASSTSVESLPADLLEILFLGTGSAIPSKYRNVTGIHLTFKQGGIVLDAGEGTLGQMYRKFGEKLGTVVANTKVIWISHMHADHHLGAVKLILEHMRVCHYHLQFR